MTNKKKTPAHDARPRYSPVVLLVDVVHFLHGQGLAVSQAHENVHQAIEACTDVLRWIGVEPDRRLTTAPPEQTAEMAAAAVLMRAAGIEPNAVKVWPWRLA